MKRKQFTFYESFHESIQNLKTNKEKYSSVVLENIKKLCTPAENRFIELKLLGYKRAEISKIMQCSTNKIDFYMQNIKRKARKFNN